MIELQHDLAVFEMCACCGLQLVAVEESALQVGAIARDIEPEGDCRAIESDAGVPAPG